MASCGWVVAVQSDSFASRVQTVVELRLAEQRPTGVSLGVLLRRSSSLIAAVVVVVKGVDHNFSGRVYSSTDINARLPFAVAGSQSYGAAGCIIRPIRSAASTATHVGATRASKLHFR